MLRLRYTSSRSLFRNKPCLTQCYTTLSQNRKSITEDIQPVKLIEDKDGVTEVYIVRRNKNGKLEHIDPNNNIGKNNKSKKNKPKKPSLLERLQNIKDNPSSNTPPEAIVAQGEKESEDLSWIRIPSNLQYHRKHLLNKSLKRKAKITKSNNFRCKSPKRSRSSETCTWFG